MSNNLKLKITKTTKKRIWYGSRLASKKLLFGVISKDSQGSLMDQKKP